MNMREIEKVERLRQKLAHRIGEKKLSPETYLAMLATDSHKWSKFGSDPWHRVSPWFFRSYIQKHASISHFAFEQMASKFLFWRHPTGLHSDPMMLNQINKNLRRL